MNAMKAISRVLLAVVFAAAGAIGVQEGIACRYDWPLLGASALMFAWSARWLLQSRRVLPVGFALAAIAFAADYHRPMGWWAVVVAILFFAAAAIEVRQTSRIT
jgi:hypothetical protein